MGRLAPEMGSVDSCVETNCVMYDMVRGVYRVDVSRVEDIDRRTCWWGPKVVGLVRVEGKRFGLTGRVVRCLGYREVYVGRKRDNRRRIEHREQYPLSI